MCTEQNKSTDGSQKHSVIRSITSAITEHAKDAILEVIQMNAPSPTKSPTSFWSHQTPHTSNTSHWSQESIQLQHMIERSLGVTALSMSKDPMIAGNMGLKNELRSEMGGAPSTKLLGTDESVNQYRNRRRKNGSRMKCSRTSRNDLIEIQDSSDDDSMVDNDKSEKAKFKKRVLLKLLSMYKVEKDEMKKEKIKYAMKALDSANESINNEMIEFTFNAHTTDLESFDSQDCVDSIIDFAEYKGDS